MKFWQKEWIKKILFIVLFTGLNVVGAIFFELGVFGILFLSGFLSIFLDRSIAYPNYRPLPPTIILLLTLIIFYFIFPIKFGHILDSIVIIGVDAIVVVCFAGGALLSYAVEVIFPRKKSK